MVTIKLTFLVVETSSAYNAILGRGALKKIGSHCVYPSYDDEVPDPERDRM
jgi:hypothetical protein